MKRTQHAALFVFLIIKHVLETLKYTFVRSIYVLEKSFLCSKGPLEWECPGDRLHNQGHVRLGESKC